MADILSDEVEPMDDETTLLVLQTQLDDISDFLQKQKGKDAEGKVNDQDLAAELCRQELETRIQVFNDNKLSRDLALALESDQHALAGMSSIMGDTTSKTKAKKPVAKPPPQNRTNGESSTSGNKKKPETATDGQCVACCETHGSKTARLQCGHAYCKSCLTQLFRSSISNKTLFPPRCCKQPIPLLTARKHLPETTVRAFEQKQAELNTPECTYCHVVSCGAFIPPPRGSRTYTSDVAKCTVCGKSTCTVCKAMAHLGDCPSDTSLQQLLSTAEQNRWQRCYKCKRIVQLEYGCHHMTCLCGASFCYVCGKAWKSCHCEPGGRYQLLPN